MRDVSGWIDTELSRIWLSGELLLRALRDAGVRRPSDPIVSELETMFAARRLDRGGSDAADALAMYQARLPGLRAATPLVTGLGLRDLELDLLMLACAPIIDPPLFDLFGVLRGARLVDVALASQLFRRTRADRLAWLDVLKPERPLASWRLLDISMPQRALTPTDDALALLGGADELPPSLAARAHFVEPADASHLVWSAEIGQAVARASARGVEASPWLAVCGLRGAGKRTVAALIAAGTGKRLLALDPRNTPRDDAFAAAQREAVLRDAVLYVGPIGDDLLGDGGRELARLLRRPSRGIILGIECDEPPPLRGLDGRALDELMLPLPGELERRKVWERAVPALATTERETLARGYQLTPGEIVEVGEESARLAARETRAITSTDLRYAIERRLRSDLGQIARKLEVSHRKDDLVLAPEDSERVREFISRTRRAAQVYDVWGLGRRIGYGRGRIALFSGPPGTGKTMIASVIARELGLELYQVDLSRVFSKWVGDTEKQLARMFDQAQRANVVLLFDEADALFGKRSEDDESSSRYANLAVNYLLQRFERYAGVAILTTNRESALDEALQRRLALHLRLDVPEPLERERLWRSFLTAGMPLAANIDARRLATEFEVSGGYIKNAVVRAAFLAADLACNVDMQILRRATALELEDMGRLVRRDVVPITAARSQQRS